MELDKETLVYNRGPWAHWEDQCLSSEESDPILSAVAGLWDTGLPEQLHVQAFGIQLTKQHCTLFHSR